MIDSRAPISSKNNRISTKTGAPRIAIFNKIDLGDLTKAEIDKMIEIETQSGADAVLFGKSSKNRDQLTLLHPVYNNNKKRYWNYGWYDRAKISTIVLENYRTV